MLQSAHDQDVALWVALTQIQGLGNAGICQLLAKFGSPEDIFGAHAKQLREVVDADITQKITEGINVEAIQPTLDWLKKDNAHLVTLADSNYPKQLLEISNPPAILLCDWQLAMAKSPSNRDGRQPQCYAARRKKCRRFCTKPVRSRLVRSKRDGAWY